MQRGRFHPIPSRAGIRRCTLALVLACGLLLLPAGSALAEKVSLQFNQPPDFRLAGYYAALWNGFFADAGIEVTFRQAPPNGDPLAVWRKVAGGGAEFGIGDTELFPAIDSGAPLTIIGSIFQHSPTRLYGFTDDPHAASGVHLLTLGGEGLHLEVLTMFLREGISPDFITIGSAQDIPEALDQLKKDGTELFQAEEPYAQYVLDQRGAHGIKSISPRTYGVDFYGDYIYVRKDILDANPDLAQRFVDAVVLGWKYALEHPEEVAGRLAEALPDLRGADDKADYVRSQIASIRRHIDFPIIPIGHINPDRMRYILDTLNRVGLIDDPEISRFFHDPHVARDLMQQRLRRIILAVALATVAAAAAAMLVIAGLKRTVSIRTRDLSVANQNLLLQIRERERAETALRASEEKFRSLFANSILGISISRPDGILLDANPSIAAMFRFPSPAEMVGTAEIFPERYCRDAASCSEAASTLTAGSTAILRDAAVVRADGTTFVANIFMHAVADPAGNYLYRQCILEDVTAQKLSEAERQLLFAVMRQTGDGLIIMDEGGSIRYANPSGRKLLGDAGDPSPSLSALPDSQLVRRLRERIGTNAPWRDRIETGGEDAAGQLIVDVAVEPVSGDDGARHQLLLLKDVTRQAHLERELAQAQKLQAIGTLASGIAHDFNNLLTPISMNAELLHMLGGSDKIMRERVDEIMAATRKARDLVKQILLFSRVTEVKLAPLDLGPLLEETATLAGRSFGPDVDYQAGPFSPGLRVRADAAQLQRALLNILSNGAHALEQGHGCLRFTAAPVTLGEDRPGPLHAVPPGRYARLRIADTGRGIPEPIRERIFDPFFTTKELGAGTGLGLSIVRRVVENHQGHIQVESSQAAGTTFDIYLPLLEEAAPSAREDSGQDAPQAPSPGSRVLLVSARGDLAALVGMVERQGREVLQAKSGAEAEALFASGPAGYGLVLTDQDMPGMTGLELAARLRRARPELPVALLAGPGAPLPTDALAQAGIAGLLGRPFDAEEVAALCGRLLRNPPTPDATDAWPTS